MNRTIPAEFFKVLALVAAIAFVLIRAPFGIDFTDSPFMLMSVTGPNPNPMLFGFNHLTRLWLGLFGETYLSLRLMQGVFGLLTCLIPYFGLVRRSEWLKQLHWLALGFLLWSTRPNSFHCDIPSLLFVSAAATLAVRYFRSKSTATYVFLTVVTGLAVLCRFPNVVAFVILWLLLPAAEAMFGDSAQRRFFDLKKIGAAIAAAVCLLLIAPLLAGKNPFVLCESMIKTVLNEFSGTHTVAMMAQQFMIDLTLMTLLGGGLFMIVELNRRCRPLRFAFACAMILCVPLYLLLQYTVFSGYNQNMRILITAIMLLFFGAGFIDASCKKDRAMGMEILILFLFGGVSMAGSNTGFINGTATWISFFAPMAVLLTPTLKKIFPSRLCAAPLWTLFFIGVTLSCFQGFEDARFDALTYRFNEPAKMRSMRTTPDKGRLIADVLADYEALRSKGEVVFFGTRSHLFCWLTENRRPFYTTFWMFPQETENEPRIEQYLRKGTCKAFFFIPSENHYNLGVPFRVDDLLTRCGYRCLPKNGYRIYVK